VPSNLIALFVVAGSIGPAKIDCIAAARSPNHVFYFHKVWFLLFRWCAETPLQGYCIGACIPATVVLIMVLVLTHPIHGPGKNTCSLAKSQRKKNFIQFILRCCHQVQLNWVIDRVAGSARACCCTRHEEPTPGEGERQPVPCAPGWTRSNMLIGLTFFFQGVCDDKSVH
jgi:hypothetical protein